ncbi:RDD family protein [Pelagibius litoralis]|uniref:RDD family protein n=1 Tax=Pelagibius litoralis TaxID=374515 RepID=A0A967F274_9PROT|nr:RDD family protein [Pelagibius litoralis]NIA71816.1 RDD family protein [Pelagibius litoralis]
MATTNPTAAPPQPKPAAARPRSERRIVTPEGVPLTFQLAERGERAAAVLIDLVIMLLALGLVVLGVVVLSWQIGFSEFIIGVTLLVFFLIRTFYFIYFELRWQGATPGKRALGLRVIDRAGGYLRPDAIFSRNILREVELFLPMTLLLAGPEDGSSGWINLLTLGWLSVFALLPFFNKDRLRAGDIVAGTWVVSAPKTFLLSDVAAGAKTRQESTQTTDPEFPFSRSQLEVYGIYELQTLEDVLRQKGPQTQETLLEVTKRVQSKIGWTGEDRVDPRRFLEAFYAAQRAHLESRLLFGERRENKHDLKGPPGAADGPTKP